MCTAYEIGKRGGSFPDRVKASAAEYLLGLAEVKLMRPKVRGPVIMQTGELERRSKNPHNPDAPIQEDFL